MKEQDLRDKFEDVEKMTFHNHLTIKTSTDLCVQIAKDYAEQEAIEFIFWIIKNGFYTWNKGKTWTKDTFPPKEKTTEELYQLFKNR